MPASEPLKPVLIKASELHPELAALSLEARAARRFRNGRALIGGLGGLLFSLASVISLPMARGYHFAKETRGAPGEGAPRAIERLVTYGAWVVPLSTAGGAFAGYADGAKETRGVIGKLIRKSGQVDSLDAAGKTDAASLARTHPYRLLTADGHLLCLPATFKNKLLAGVDKTIFRHLVPIRYRARVG
jgi:hypothetical protein